MTSNFIKIDISDSVSNHLKDIGADINNHNIITFYKKINMPKNNLSKNKKISFILKQVNNIMSQWIKDQPENWLWIHRRWQKDLYV